MEIELRRTQSNHLYTEGVLFIGGIKYTHTEEHTFTMPSPGVYTITRSNLRQFFGAGNSWRDALTENRIILGDPATSSTAFTGASRSASIPSPSPLPMMAARK